MPSSTTFITVYLIISKTRSPVLGSLPLSPRSACWHNRLMYVCYWKCKSKINHQVKPSTTPPSKSDKTPTTSSMNSSGSKASPDVKGKTSTTSSTPKPDLMSKLDSNGKLTSDERKRRFNNKLYMFCRAGGHMAKDCPKSTSRASKGRSATTTPETKLEDSSESQK